MPDVYRSWGFGVEHDYENKTSKWQDFLFIATSDNGPSHKSCFVKRSDLVEGQTPFLFTHHIVTYDIKKKVSSSCNTP